MTAQQELFEILESQGYTDLKQLDGRGIVGLHQFLFTTGLIYGLDESRYIGRYCFEREYEARAALDQWDGINDPSGNWIKHKGRIEYSNPNYQK